MRRAREAQLTRLAARTTAAEDAAAGHGAALRARVKIGVALRQTLAKAGIDPATVAMLRICDAAALELAATADHPGPSAGTATPLAGAEQPDGSAELFDARIRELARRSHDGQDIDFALASLAAAFAWCLGRLETSPAGEPGTAESSRGSTFAADLLQKQRQIECDDEPGKARA